MRKIRIAYIGGGSKMWARIFMNDLALDKDITGEIVLYDIDHEASIRNQQIGSIINELSTCNSKWQYTVCDDLYVTLQNADFVILSILPGTFDEMMVDVHLPEKYGIYQTVGDTVGPGGVLRSMRVVPIYEEFAKAIAKVCPEAWVINFTNPMNICVKTLYDVFPKIKAFGCCHEVFHAQTFLAMVVEEKLGLKERPKRTEIKIDVAGINHFTWISQATYKNNNILPWINDFSNNHFKEGIYEGTDPFAFKYNTYAYGNKVKMDLYRRYQVLAAAGDRHLVEFVNNNWYLKDPNTINKWAIAITPVQSRINDQNRKVAESIAIIKGEKQVILKQSTEEAVQLMKAILGLNDMISNINYPNYGQIRQLPLGSIVESNCEFKANAVSPILSNDLPIEVINLINRNCLNIDNLYLGIKERNFKKILASFINQPLCSSLTINEARDLFIEMVKKTRKYLDPYYDVDYLISTI